MELVKVATNAQGVQVVSARELYVFLGYNITAWKRWYQKNIIDNEFAIDEVDYSIHLDTMSSSNKTEDFALTLDFAKRLSQMARTEKGEQIRNYFIACEESLKKLSLPSDAEMELMVINRLKQKAEQERLLREAAQRQLEIANDTIKDMVPVCEYANNVLNSDGLITPTTIAKELGMTAIKFNRKLKERKIIFTQSKNWYLYAKYDGFGYTGSTTYPYKDKQGRPQTAIETRWTETGRQFVHQIFKNGLSAQGL